MKPFIAINVKWPLQRTSALDANRARSDPSFGSWWQATYCAASQQKEAQQAAIEAAASPAVSAAEVAS